MHQSHKMVYLRPGKVLRRLAFFPTDCPLTRKITPPIFQDLAMLFMLGFPESSLLPSLQVDGCCAGTGPMYLDTYCKSFQIYWLMIKLHKS